MSGATFVPPPPVYRSTVFRFQRWESWDIWRRLLSWRGQARCVARKLLAGPYAGWDFADETKKLVIEMPSGSFRVIDASGRVEPHRTIAV